MKIFGIILAAGTSSRMATVNKLLLEYGNHTIVGETLTQLQNSEVDHIIVVTGFESEEVKNALAGIAKPDVEFVHNSKYRLGRAESIKCAVEHMAGEAEAALFMVADKPGVSTDLINRAIQLFKSDRPAVLHVETPAGRGHPIIFSKTVFDDLMRLEGDFCGDDLVSKYRGDLVKLWDESQQLDIDSDADYRILLKQKSGDKDM